MKTFSDKENLAKKVKLLQQKREWSNVAELKEMVEVSLVSMFDCVTLLASFFIFQSPHYFVFSLNKSLSKKSFILWMRR